MGLWGKKPSGSKRSVSAQPTSAAATSPRAAKKHAKRRRKRGAGPSTGPAATTGPLQDRRRRLVSAREATLRDLGGLMLEMYKRNRFREELLLDKCEEVLAIEVEIAHVDQRLFQLAPTTASGQRPIGRCECSAPILPGQNFCAVCGRAFATLTQSRSCVSCGSGLRTADAFCATCGTAAPDLLAPADAPVTTIDAPSVAGRAADTIALEAVTTREPSTDGTTEHASVIDPGGASDDVGVIADDLKFSIRTEPAVPPSSPTDAAINAALAMTESADDTSLDVRTTKRISREKRRQIKQMAKAKARAKAHKARARDASRRKHVDGDTK